MTRVDLLQGLLKQRTVRLWQLVVIGLFSCALLASIAYGLRHDYLVDDRVFQTDTHATVPAELRDAIIAAHLEAYLDRGTDQEWDLVDTREDWSYLILLTMLAIFSCVAWIGWLRGWKTFLATIGVLLILFEPVYRLTGGTPTREPDVLGLIAFDNLRDAEAPREILETPHEVFGNAADICLHEKGSLGLKTIVLPSGRCGLAINPTQLSSIQADQAHLVLAQHAFVAKRGDVVLRHLQEINGGWSFRDSHNFWRLRTMVLAMEHQGYGRELPPAVVAMAKPAKLEADNRLGGQVYSLSGAFLFLSITLAFLAMRRTSTLLKLRSRTGELKERLTSLEHSTLKTACMSEASYQYAAISE